MNLEVPLKKRRVRIDFINLDVFWKEYKLNIFFAVFRRYVRSNFTISLMIAFIGISAEVSYTNDPTPKIKWLTCMNITDNNTIIKR